MIQTISAPSFVTAAKLIGIGLNFCSLFFVARFVPKDHAGVYFAWLNMVVVGTLFAQIGVPQTLMRELAQRTVNAKSVNLYWQFSNIFAVSLFAAFVTPFLIFNAGVTTEKFLYLSLAIVACVNYNLIVFIERGRFNHIGASSRESIIKPICVCAITVISILTGYADSADTLAAAYCIATLILLVMERHFFCAQSAAGSIINWDEIKCTLKGVYKIGLNGGLTQLIITLDVILVSWLLSPEKAAEVKIAVSFAGIASIYSISRQYVATPIISRMINERRFLEAKSFARAQTFQSLASLVILWPVTALVLFYFSDLMFGRAYTGLHQILLLLMPPYILNTILGFLSIKLIAYRAEKQTIIVIFLVCLSYVTLSLVLIPAYGMLGLSSAFSCSCLFGLFLSRHVLRKIEGVQI